MKLKKIAALLAAAGPMVVAAPAFATNGMNMEGYGPIATGMGGASMAYDNGTAGLINNPATLGLMKSGSQRFDIAIGGLHPSVGVSIQGMGSADSSGDAYYMPAIGYVRKDGNLTWGAGMMSQGGMGTEWGRTSVLSSGGLSSGTFTGLVRNLDAGPFGVPAGQPGTNLEQRSELGIGRFIVPLTYDVSPTFRLGGSFDYVWGGLDAMMLLDGNTFNNMAGNANNANKRAVGYINSNSTMLNAFGGLTNTLVNPGALGVDYAHLSMSEGTNKFKQELTTNGTAWNIGFQWQATPALALGAVYHAQTNLSDMSGNATMTIKPTGGAAMAVRGSMKVVNFQWPETYGVGLSYQASDKWQIAADYKSIQWSKVMQQFHMVFNSSMGTMDMGLNQNWADQNVFQFGASYKFDDTITLRFGANLSDNPIPNENLNPLFPATVENHFTFGAGFALDKSSAIDFSLTLAPSVDVRNPGMPIANAPAFFGTTTSALSSSHSQTNWQLMYSNKF